MTYEKLKKYYSIGINRLSIGLQSTNNNLLKDIGRIHTYEQFLETYKLARKAGFKNINVDLMLGLPGQTVHDLQESLENVVNLKPEHISAYSLILEETTVLYTKKMNNEITLPSDEIEREMYWLVKKHLEKNNYEHYEISNFALENSAQLSYRALHNTNCWEQKEYVGIGAGASSFLDNKRYVNSSEIEEYIENNVRDIEEILDKDAKMREYVILGLRKIDGIDLEKFKVKFKVDFFSVFNKEFDKLHSEGLLLFKNGNVKLSDRGIDLANLVWEEWIIL